MLSKPINTPDTTANYAGLLSAELFGQADTTTDEAVVNDFESVLGIDEMPDTIAAGEENVLETAIHDIETARNTYYIIVASLPSKQMAEKQIECFLTVSKYQSFSRAAQALFMTQPTVTHQIAALEEELGFSLFVRSYRAISLTPAGQRFEERMRPAVEQLQSIVSECKQIARNEDGCLTLGHYFPEGDWMFYHAIYAFSSLYPAFHIDTHLPPSTELVDRLLTRQLDAIVAPHQLITVQDELKQTTLFSNPEYCVMSRNHPLAERESLTLNDLQDTLCLLDNDDPFKIKTWHETQIRAQRSQFSSRNGRTMREIVTNLRSQPCVMLSLYPVLFIADDLVRVPFADGPQVQTDLVWRADNAKAALAHLVDYLPRYYAESIG